MMKKIMGIMALLLVVAMIPTTASAFIYQEGEDAVRSRPLSETGFFRERLALVERGDTLSGQTVCEPFVSAIQAGYGLPSETTAKVACWEAIQYANGLRSYNSLSAGSFIWLPDPTLVEELDELEKAFRNRARVLALGDNRDQMALGILMLTGDMRRVLPLVDDEGGLSLPVLEAAMNELNQVREGGVTAEELSTRLGEVSEGPALLGGAEGSATETPPPTPSPGDPADPAPTNAGFWDQPFWATVSLVPGLVWAIAMASIALALLYMWIKPLRAQVGHQQTGLEATYKKAESAADAAGKAQDRADQAHTLAAKAAQEARVATNLGLPDDWQLIGDLPSDKEVRELKNDQSVTLRFRHETKGERQARFVMAKGSIQGRDGNFVDGLQVAGISGLIKPIKVGVGNMIGKVRKGINSNRFVGIDAEGKTAGPTALSA